MVSPVGYKTKPNDQFHFKWQRTRKKLTGPAWRIFREFTEGFTGDEASANWFAALVIVGEPDVTRGAGLYGKKSEHLKTRQQPKPLHFITDQNWAVGPGTADGSAKPLVGFLVDLLSRRVVISCFGFFYHNLIQLVQPRDAMMICFTCNVERNRLALVGDFGAATENRPPSCDARLVRLRCRRSN